MDVGWWLMVTYLLVSCNVMWGFPNVIKLLSILNRPILYTNGLTDYSLTHSIHSLTRRPSSMTVGDSRWPLRCISRLCTVRGQRTNRLLNNLNNRDLTLELSVKTRYFLETCIHLSDTTADIVSVTPAWINLLNAKFSSAVVTLYAKQFRALASCFCN